MIWKELLALYSAVSFEAEGFRGNARVNLEFNFSETFKWPLASPHPHPLFYLTEK